MGLNKHCRARPCKSPQPYHPDFGPSMSHLFGMCHERVWVPKLLRGMYLIGLTWKDQNLGRKVEVR